MDREHTSNEVQMHYVDLVSQYTQALTDGDQAKASAVQFEILSSLGVNAPPLLVLISSLMPGTGASTVRSLLAEVLGYEHAAPDEIRKITHDAGKFRRMLAKIYLHWKKSNKAHASQETWDKFMVWFRVNSTQAIQKTIRSYQKHPTSDKLLRQFNLEEKEYATKDDEIVLTKVPDLGILREIRGEKTGVYAGKLTAKIDDIGHAEEEFAAFEALIVRFFLVVDASVGANRVIQRDMANGKIETLSKDSQEFKNKVRHQATQNEERIDRDWKNYANTYGLDPEEFRRSFETVFHIDTTALSPEEVVGEMLSIIHDELSKSRSRD